VGLLDRFWSLFRSNPAPPPKPNAECPICGRKVVIGAQTMMGGRLGPMLVPATREEKVAACLEHGRPPFNERTRVADGG
jgi:hypothetical protein